MLLRALILSLMLAAAACKQGANVSGAYQLSASNTRAQSNRPCLNLNTATADELMKLPGIGEVMSRRIIEYRERHGPFRRPQDVIIIEGFSERKYRALAELVCVE